MFVWAPIPEPYAEMDSVEFCSLVVRECDVALSPGVGFGPGGEGFVRFALIENEQRIAQGIRNLRKRPAPSSADALGTDTRSFTCWSPSGDVADRLPLPPRAPPYVVRVWLPDRPGALGQVASRIGAVRGDVSASRSSSRAPAGRSTSWWSRCPTTTWSPCSSPRSTRSTA